MTASHNHKGLDLLIAKHAVLIRTPASQSNPELLHQQLTPTPPCRYYRHQNPQVITRSKSAVIEHLRDAAPDKIDVITHVNAQNLNMVLAQLLKITGGWDAADDASLTLFIVR